MEGQVKIFFYPGDSMEYASVGIYANLHHLLLSIYWSLDHHLELFIIIPISMELKITGYSGYNFKN